MNIYYVNDNDDPKEDNNSTTPSNKPEIPEEQKDNNTPKNNKKRNIIIALVLTILIGVGGYFSYNYISRNSNIEVVTIDSCITNSNAELYDHYKHSVVMIKNRFGLEVKINNSDPIILEDYYVENFEFYASGFFVDEKGRIVTNKHVVSPPIPYPENVDTELKNLKIKIVANLPRDTSPSEYKEKLYQILRYGSLEREELEIDLTDSIDLDNIEPNVVEYFENYEIEIEPISLELKVMSHDTDEWLPAKVLKTSDDYNIDVAVIQLDSETTPSIVTNVVKIENFMIEDTEIKPGTKAIMIGFPMGMNLASNTNGIIKAQMYEGDINKESDGVKFQYSIPSSQGASGAPVFDPCGRLIAVNFSGYDQRGFNFGIVSKHVYNLISEYYSVAQPAYKQPAE